MHQANEPRCAACGAARASQRSRPGLVEQLLFLEQRGASTAVKQLAIRRAGLTPESSGLLAQQLGGFAAGRVEGGGDAVAAPPPGARAGRRNPAGWALAKIGSGIMLWGVVVLGGLMFGYLLGFDAGINDGVEIGLDRLQSAINRVALR